MMEAHGDDAACEPLVHWLLLAITRSGTGAGPSLARTPPTVPLADRNLLEHWQKLLQTHLPELLTPAATDPSGSLSTLMSELVQEQRLSRADPTLRAEQTAAPKTVAKALGSEVAASLLILCQVTTEEDLPKFWVDVAQAGKRDRQALEQALLAKARDLSMAEVAPVATPDLVKRVVGLQWAGLSIDDLSEGIQPFGIVLPDYVGSDAGVEAQKLAETYDIMATTGTTSTLTDAKTVKTGKAVIPVDFSEACAHLVALMLLWSVLLGDDHPFVLAYGRFLQTYTGREYSYQNKLWGLQVKEPPAALFLRYVQLRTVTYWRQAINYRALPATPNFEDLLDKLEMQDRSWIPTLPHKYWKPLVKPGEGASILGSVISGLTFPSSSASTNGTGLTPSQEGGPKGAGTGGTVAKTDRTQQAPAKNVQISECFAPFLEKVKSMTIKAAIAKGGQPPSVTREGRSRRVLEWLCSQW